MKALDYLFAARPLLHLPVWSVYLVSLHYHFNLSGRTFQWSNLGMMLLLSASAAAAYYVNQVYDEKGDFVNQKLGFLQREILSAQSLRAGYLILSFISMAGASLFSLQMVFVFSQLALLGFAYSAPPFRLKDRPFWGLFANAYGFGFLIVFTVVPNFSFHNAGSMAWDNPFFFAASVGAIYILTTIPDVAGDRASGKRTIAVVMGTRSSILLSLSLIGIAVFSAYKSGHYMLVAIAGVAGMLAVGALIRPSEKLTLAAAKMPILLLTLLAGYHFPIYLLFIVALVSGTRLYYKRRFGLSYPRLA